MYNTQASSWAFHILDRTKISWKIRIVFSLMFVLRSIANLDEWVLVLTLQYLCCAAGERKLLIPQASTSRCKWLPKQDKIWWRVPWHIRTSYWRVSWCRMCQGDTCRSAWSGVEYGFLQEITRLAIEIWSYTTVLSLYEDQAVTKLGSLIPTQHGLKESNS